MKFRYLVMLLVALLAAAPALAAESLLTGEISAGLRAVSGNDNDTSAKFQEYRDLDSNHGVSGGLSLFGTNGSFYLTADADNLGLDDASADLRIGSFDNFRLSLFYDEMEHNYSFNALTVYQGVGSDTLTLAPGLYRSTNPAVWLPFDYTVDREQYGAKGEITLGSPFFVAFDVTQTEKDGVVPWGINSTSGSPGSFFAELPMPIDYTTTNATAQIGYRTKALTVSLDGMLSSFDNDNDYLRAVSPSNNTYAIDPIYMAPDNDMMQIGGQLVLRELPLTSTLALRGSYAKLESDADILGFQKFEGEETYTTASAILRSRPTTSLETEIAYRYVDKENDSDQIDTGDGLNELFHYTKHNASVEAGYHLTANNRIGAGYEFTRIDRAEEVRHDAEETKDHEIFAEWKNSSLDFLTAKLRYEHLERDTDFPTLPANPVGLDLGRPFDAAEKDQDTVRVMLDFAPVEGLDMGIEYKLVAADYDETILGRTDEDKQEVIVDASIALPAKANLYAYVAYEQVESEYKLWRGGGTTHPFTEVQSNSAYPSTNNREDEGWSYGAKLEVPLFEERLKLCAAWDYQKNDGDMEFETGEFPTPTPVDISEYGDYTKNTFDLKAEYAISKSMDFIVGYLYEKYELDDLQYNNYDYVYGSSASSTSYLTGAYADADYEAKIGYVALKYKF